MSQKSKIPYSIITIICSAVLFIALLAIRLDYFRDLPSPILPDTRVAEKESWMSITQNGNKIGYTHRKLTPTDCCYEISETIFMKIDTMGIANDLNIKTNAVLNPDFTLFSFDFTLMSDIFNFTAKGQLRDSIFTISTGDQNIQIETKHPVYISSAILSAAWSSGISQNMTKTFNVFDPSTMSSKPVEITFKGNESIEIQKESIMATVAEVDFMGTKQTAWIDDQGNIVKEKGFMGITLTKTSKEDALETDAVSASEDLTKLVSVPVKTPVNNKTDLSALSLKLSGIDLSGLFPDGGRQSLNNDILTITKEDLSYSRPINNEDRILYTSPSLLIQSDHPDIIETTFMIISPEDDDLVKATKLVNWVHDNLEKRPVISIPSAIETLNNRMGDCNEHAALLTALARAAGIPAQIEAGLVYTDNRFYYHAWNVLFIDQWVTADSLMGQIPADVTHIRLVRGGLNNLNELARVIGKINIEILEHQK
ncbi:MAG: transglutaminase-like domain-containing protein [Desulfobacterales bacterium]|nr:transglutaminase-like domain-containing protein [Desulfobacterales bacterium]